MRVRSLASRAVVWAAVCTLVLRAGMPLLAVVAAQLDGVPVGEVCEVYGVVLPNMPARQMSGHAHRHARHSHHHPESNADQGCDHCALVVLGAMGVPNGGLPPLDSRSASGTVDVAVSLGCPLHDACAAWVARLEHGPPGRA